MNDETALALLLDAALTALLAKHGLGHVMVERTQEPPSPSPGGKYRAVIPFVDSAR